MAQVCDGCGETKSVRKLSIHYRTADDSIQIGSSDLINRRLDLCPKCGDALSHNIKVLLPNPNQKFTPEPKGNESPITKGAGMQ